MLFERYLALLQPAAGQRALEVGVGFGRLVPSLLKAGLHVHGIDISPAMIAEARKHWDAGAVDLRAAEAEKLPYPDRHFDLVVCWAVFDACYQAAALAEMARVLAVGGRLLLTGKNADYRDDDEMAYVAEVNARAKGHPNYFTDVAALVAALPAVGLTQDRLFRFARRGDLTENRVAASPAHFYEYVLTAVKTAHTGRGVGAPIAAAFSDTFRRRHRARTSGASA